MKAEIAKSDAELYFVLVGAPDDQALSSREYQEELRYLIGRCDFRASGSQLAAMCTIQ